MSFSAIGLKILIMTDNYASYNKRIFWNELPSLWGRRIAQVRVFRSTTFFPLPPINTSSTTLVLLAISTQNFCDNEISINNPVDITIRWHVLDSKNRFYKALKLATKALKCIV